MLFQYARLRADSRAGVFATSIAMAMTRLQERWINFEAHPATKTTATDWFGHLLSEFVVAGIASFYNTPMAREMRRITMLSEMKIWIMARILAQRARSGASVGPKVELWVKATKR